MALYMLVNIAFVNFSYKQQILITIMHNKLLRYILGITAICAFSATMLHAQEEEEVIVLEEVDADSVPIEESILATSRPFVSLYGTEKGIVDTPRNVTIISRAQLDAISIRDPRDFTKVTSSAYTQSNFGAPSNPSIRGQTADMLVNGMRRGLDYQWQWSTRKF